jgi:hypothetical protein
MCVSQRSKSRKAKALVAFVVSIAATIAILSFANSASAVPLTWTLMSARFDDGGSATGSFTYDADTNTYLDFNISSWRRRVVSAIYVFASDLRSLWLSSSCAMFYFPQ